MLIRSCNCLTHLASHFANAPVHVIVLPQSAAFAKCKTANTYTSSVNCTLAGQELMDQQQFKSRQRYVLGFVHGMVLLDGVVL